MCTLGKQLQDIQFRGLAFFTLLVASTLSWSNDDLADAQWEGNQKLDSIAEKQERQSELQEDTNKLLRHWLERSTPEPSNYQDGLSKLDQLIAIQTSVQNQQNRDQQSPVELPGSEHLIRLQFDPFAAATGKAAAQFNPRHKLFDDGDFDPSKDSIDFLLVTVPDPRVPRLKREFDLLTNALIQGMAHRKFLTVRYYYPWKLDEPEYPLKHWLDTQRIHSTKESLGRVIKKMDSTPNVQDTLAAFTEKLVGPQAEFGVIIFRQDHWRCWEKSDKDEQCNPNRRHKFRVVYLVAERPSSGLQINALAESLLNITLQQYWLDQSKPNQSLELIGPLYSGSVGPLVANLSSHGREWDFLRAVLEELSIEIQKTANPEIPSNSDGGANSKQAKQPTNRTRLTSVAKMKFDALSPTATAETNLALFVSQDKTERKCTLGEEVCMTMYAPNDEKRWKKIFPNNKTSSDDTSPFKSSDTLCLLENSAYGREFNCGEQRRIFFPPNLWEIRAATDPEETKNSDIPNFESLITGSRELRIDVDLGSEYPASYARYTTSRTSELNLLATLRHVETGLVECNDKTGNCPPNNILIVSTDVRDQLFLAEFLAREVPQKQLFFANGDRLLAHPEYIDATRGSVVAMSSLRFEEPAPENPPTFQLFANETAVRVFDLVIDIDERSMQRTQGSEQVNEDDEKQVILHVVTRQGLKELQPLPLKLPVYAVLAFAFLLCSTGPLTLWRKSLQRIGQFETGPMLALGEGTKQYLQKLAVWIPTLVWGVFTLIPIAEFSPIHALSIAAIGLVNLVAIRASNASEDGRLSILLVGVIVVAMSSLDFDFGGLDGVNPTSVQFLLMFVAIVSAVLQLSISASSYTPFKPFEPIVSSSVVLLVSLLVAMNSSLVHPLQESGSNDWGFLLVFTASLAVLFAMLHLMQAKRILEKLFDLEGQLTKEVSPTKEESTSKENERPQPQTTTHGHSYLLFCKSSLDSTDSKKHQASSLITTFTNMTFISLLLPIVVIIIVFITPISNQSVWVTVSLGELIFFSITGYQRSLRLDRLKHVRILLGYDPESAGTLSIYINYALIPLSLIVIGILLALVPGVRAWTESWLPAVLRLIS